MRMVLAAAALACIGTTALADDLCPDVAKRPVSEGTRMTEDTFEVPAGLDAADKLMTSLDKAKISYEFEQVVDAFVVKGVILRQQALAARTSRELSELKLKTGAATKAEADMAAAGAAKALEKFCTFMLDAVVAE